MIELAKGSDEGAKIGMNEPRRRMNKPIFIDVVFYYILYWMLL